MKSESKKRVIIVEDEPAIRELVVDIVRKLGYKAVVASRCEEALVKMEKIKIDLALLDLGLPTEDGFWLAEKIKAANPKTPVIIMSGVNLPKTRIRKRLKEVDGFLLKPFEVETIIEKIRSVLAGRGIEAANLK